MPAREGPIIGSEPGKPAAIFKWVGVRCLIGYSADDMQLQVLERSAAPER
jgi:hypothetical protein